MSITDIKKEYLIEKYKYLLKYSCNINSDKLCNELSYNKSGHCIKCEHIIRNEMYDLLEQYNKNEKNIVTNIQYLLSINDDMTKKNDNETSKEYKVKNVINIFEILYHNMFFTILNPKFLITITNKIIEIIGTEKNFIIKFINRINHKKNILKYMCDMYDFINNYKKNKNVNIDYNMSKENFELFLDSYIKFMENYYNNIFLQNKKIDSINNINIDINNFDNFQIVLDL
jgi:hypothetical protein